MLFIHFIILTHTHISIDVIHIYMIWIMDLIFCQWDMQFVRHLFQFGALSNVIFLKFQNISCWIDWFLYYIHTYTIYVSTFIYVWTFGFFWIEFIVANGIYAPCSRFMFNQHKIPKTISNKISLSFSNRMKWIEESLKKRRESIVARKKERQQKRYQIKVLVNVCKSKPYPLIKINKFLSTHCIMIRYEFLWNVNLAYSFQFCWI